MLCSTGVKFPRAQHCRAWRGGHRYNLRWLNPLQDHSPVFVGDLVWNQSTIDALSVLWIRKRSDVGRKTLEIAERHPRSVWVCVCTVYIFRALSFPNYSVPLFNRNITLKVSRQCFYIHNGAGFRGTHRSAWGPARRTCTIRLVTLSHLVSLGSLYHLDILQRVKVNNK